MIKKTIFLIKFNYKMLMILRWPQKTKDVVTNRCNVPRPILGDNSYWFTLYIRSAKYASADEGACRFLHANFVKTREYENVHRDENVN